MKDPTGHDDMDGIDPPSAYGGAEGGRAGSGQPKAPGSNGNGSQPGNGARARFTTGAPRRAPQPLPVKRAAGAPENLQQGVDDLNGFPQGLEPGAGVPAGRSQSTSERRDWPDRRPRRPAFSRLVAEQAARAALQASTPGLIHDSARRLAHEPAPASRSEIDRMGIHPQASAAVIEQARLAFTLSAAASRAAAESEARLLAVACLPLALQNHPGIYRALWPALPALSLGVDELAGLLYRSPQARHLLKGLPLLLDAVARRLAALAGEGRRLTARLAASVLAEQVFAWLSEYLDPQSFVGME